MMVREAIFRAAARLEEVSDTPRLDAELLMAHALGVDREALLLGGMDGPEPAGFAALVDRRLDHEPVAYLVGRRAFWTIDLEVGPGALVPRPESETLIEAAIDHFGLRAPANILDLGTGPGTLLLAALDHWPEARGIGVDRSDRALHFARRNAERLGMSERTRFIEGDWSQALGRFDLILANPPYVEADAALDPQVRDWEPAEALFAGADGLDAFRRLAFLVGPRLAPGGVACIEIGVGQADPVEALFAPSGLAVERRADLSGRTRCLVLRAD